MWLLYKQAKRLIGFMGGKAHKQNIEKQKQF